MKTVDDLRITQEQREADAIAQRLGLLHREAEKRGEGSSQAALSLFRPIVEELAVDLGVWLVDGKEGRATRQGTVGGELMRLEAKTGPLALLTVRHALHSVTRHSTQYATHCHALGRLVREHLEWQMAWDSDDRRYFKAVQERTLNRTSHEHHTRRVARHVTRTKGYALAWDVDMEAKVGLALMTRLLAVTGHFYTEVHKTRQHKSQKVLLVSEEALAALETLKEDASVTRPVWAPMVCEPLPWTNPYDGGFLTLPQKLVGTYTPEHDAALEAAEMPHVYEAVNTLQSTPWRVNRRVLAVLAALWEEGAQVAGLPARDNTPPPARPWDPEEEPAAEVLRAWKNAARLQHEANRRLASKRIQAVQLLHAAKELADVERLYFVHKLDFRGRAYPATSTLSPQGDDLNRGLLEFAEGRALGKEGYYWLAVHVANCFGEDKVSFEDRVRWTSRHVTAIRAVAANPLEELWWTEADDPWQFLAACFDYADAQALEDPEWHVSHLPVGMDGSANGLQHFAALLRDPEGAQAVNMNWGEKPADIYQRVADRVLELLEEEPRRADGKPTEAAYWQDYAGDWRGLVKRPVMTIPYGLTGYGLEKQLEAEMMKRHGPDDWSPRCKFLGGLIEQALGDVVSAASEAMDWLKAASEACTDADMPLRWVTPTGFPVVQDYRRTIEKRIETWVGGKKFKLKLQESTHLLDKGKARNASSPNFVHSMDAAHMMATALRFEEGACLAMVHDSYATHAGSVEDMHHHLRMAFAELYATDWLQALYHALRDQGVEAPPPPALGTYDPVLVLAAPYFFA